MSGNSARDMGEIDAVKRDIAWIRDMLKEIREDLRSLKDTLTSNQVTMTSSITALDARVTRVEKEINNMKNEVGRLSRVTIEAGERSLFNRQIILILLTSSGVAGLIAGIIVRVIGHG